MLWKILRKNYNFQFRKINYFSYISNKKCPTLDSNTEKYYFSIIIFLTHSCQSCHLNFNVQTYAVTEINSYKISTT